MPNGQWGGSLTVIEEVEVSNKIDAECLTFPRLREAWEGLHWLLARLGSRIGREPKSGNPNLRLYVMSHDNIVNIPAIWVLYEIGQDEIIIHDINVVSSMDDED